MDTIETRTEPAFHFDLAGRVRNLGLPASAVNALIPLFEAVSNGIHAIEARFGTNATSSGQIEVLVNRRDGDADGAIQGFTIRDNGIGLTEENWNSFRTSDSPYKLTRGGKGVGRLSWLKAFSDCRIQSRFEENGAVWERSFAFSLRDPNPIQNHVLRPADPGAESGTEIRLEPYTPPFDAHCPKKLSTIAAKLVGHFLPYFVVNRCPSITITDVDEGVELGHFYSDNQQRSEVDIITSTFDLLAKPEEFHVYHVLLKKQLKFLERGGLHWLFWAGNERVAQEDAIDGQIGLKYVGENEDCVYIGLVTSPYLDRHVNQERTAFTFRPETGVEIHKAVLATTKNFLSDYIGRIRAQQQATADRVIRENPQFLPFRDILGDVVNSLSLNTQGEEEIFLELSRRRLRNRRRVEGRLRSLQNNAGDDLEKDVQELSKALNDEKKSSLAEYVVRRKAILELLDSSLAYQQPEKRRYYKEEVIHDLIVPLRSNSEDLDYTQHNLWILDDRLAFYTFFRSDKPMRTFVEGAESGKEPDLAIIFEQSLAFRRDGQDEPIVIIEFKRPGRDDYDGNSSPVTQVLEYVDLFRSGKAVKDKDGRSIKAISESTRFICYVVADFTDSLLNVVRYSVANNPTADGRGFFGVSTRHNATIEVLPYEKVLDDARIRNEAFFKHLGLL